MTRSSWMHWNQPMMPSHIIVAPESQDDSRSWLEILHIWPEQKVYVIGVDSAMWIHRRLRWLRRVVNDPVWAVSATRPMVPSNWRFEVNQNCNVGDLCACLLSHPVQTAVDDNLPPITTRNMSTCDHHYWSLKGHIFPFTTFLWPKTEGQKLAVINWL